MRNKAIEYPHPVLNEYTNDYINSSFGIEVLSHTDNGSDIVIELECLLNCDGLATIIAEGKAKPIVRVTCYRTSYRDTIDLYPSGSTIIKIEKRKVTGSIDIQAMIVATQEFEDFRLPEFNQGYFGNIGFHIRKGDVLANEPGINVKLNTTLEKNMAGIVLVRVDPRIQSMRVDYAETTEMNPELSDYIVISLPDMDWKNYARLMSKKHLKNGVERFIQASVILPAITEAVGLLRVEESTEGDDGEAVTSYRGTVWADSIYSALTRLGLSLSDTKSDYEIANILLGNIASDSLSNLMQKLTEWSTIREEDPSL